ncbi:MAG: hypothetical protein HDR10_12140, partial [Lachnospiraceae bacterium]|nr:hypothetical protein [Lachnospiraceae bacterium]
MIRTSLFTFNFSKWVKRVCKIAAGFILVAVLVHWLNFLYSDPYEWGRVLWHDYYEQEENIDSLFIGSSHVYSDIDPLLSDEIDGGNHFNLSTGNQGLNSSYYLLKEADKEHDISHIYLELYYGVTTGKRGDYMAHENLVTGWYNADYMKFSLNKLEYMLTLGNVENYPETFLPFVRYRKNLFDVEYIGEQIEKKRGEDYKKYIYLEKSDSGEIIGEYGNKGYRYQINELQKDNLCIRKENNQKICLLSEDAEQYLKKIIEYCQKRGIEITLFSSPIYELQLISIEDYDVYVEQVCRIADEYGVPYYDFNLCREECFPIQDIRNFVDLGHLNSRGAEIYTTFFWKVMKEGKRDYFYNTYAEKLQNSKEAVYGLFYTEEEGVRSYRIASNREKGMEYRISIRQEDGAETELQDFSENKMFQLKSEEHGTCR